MENRLKIRPQKLFLMDLLEFIEEGG